MAVLSLLSAAGLPMGLSPDTVHAQESLIGERDQFPDDEHSPHFRHGQSPWILMSILSGKTMSPTLRSRSSRR